MTGKWLSIVGLGEGGLDDLSPAARSLIGDAECFVGGARHLAMLPEDERERLTWPSPLQEIVAQIAARRGKRVCVLATGDPMHYGVGVTLARHFPLGEIAIVPHLSAFSLAAARLGWPLSEVDCLTAHGRPLSLVTAYLQPGARLLILSEDGATPGALATHLTGAGFGPSRIVVLEHMGGAKENVTEGTAQAWCAGRAADFNTVAVECRAAPGVAPRPRIPGLPDDAFASDGQITKREVRAITLAALAPAPGALLWDVGAGCGSVAVEWMRADPRCRAVAIEKDQARRAFIADNASALGTPRLDIVAVAAPGAFEGLDPPDAVFLGGGLSEPGLIEAAWAALPAGGRLVANAVTLEAERRLLAWHAGQGGELRRIAVSRAEPVGPFSGWRPFMPVTQYAGAKP